jgi:hypothetical protein
MPLWGLHLSPEFAPGPAPPGTSTTPPGEAPGPAPLRGTNDPRNCAGTGPTQGTSATTGTCAGVSPARGTTQAPSSELAKTGNHHGGEDAPVADPRSALRAPHAPSSARGAKTRWDRGDPRADTESACPFPARATSSEQRKTANAHKSRDAPTACPQAPFHMPECNGNKWGQGQDFPIFC